MHTSAEDVIVEIVDPQGRVVEPGVPGEIVVTHLATGAYPFVRYRTGDVAAWAEAQCPCGRGLPVLTEIQGRTTDFVVATDGTIMHGLALIYVVRDLPGLHGFKIVQESLQRTRLWVVAEDDFLTRWAATIRDGFRARLGPEVEIAIERVAAIPPERSGKFRYVSSAVSAERELTVES
jgi:phenylacetate-CoA ligase